MSLEYPGGPNVITSILTKGRQEVEEKRRIHGACFEDGRRRLGLWKVEMVRKRVVAVPWKERSPVD